MGNPHHPEEARAAAVADMVIGKPLSRISRETGIPYRTLRDWREKANIEAVVWDYREQLGEYIEIALTTLIKQAEHFGDKEWLMKQDAHDLGVQHGILGDKLIQILKAVQDANGGPLALPDGA